MEQEPTSAPIPILVVDDDQLVLESMLLLLNVHGYRVMTARNGIEALDRVIDQAVQIVLTDIRMPRMDGIDLAGRLHERDPDLPVLIMTGYAEVETAVGALKRGAFDFIIKPVNPDHLLHALHKAAEFSAVKTLERNYRLALEAEVKQKTKQLRDLNREIISRLTVVAEYRDTDTGQHISRIGRFSGLLAEELGLPAEYTETLSLASSLHDIGKVAIPDRLLLKPGPLTMEEFEVIKTHAALGAKMLEGSGHAVIRMAESIARHHHERWDGSGYPQGLRGAESPIEGRIVMLADQYDALRARRPYKEPFSHQQACRIILEGDSRTLSSHFDLEILRAFRKKAPDFARVFEEFQQ